MGPFTQVLLFFSYAVLGLAFMVIPPRLFGLSDVTSGMIGMFVFFGAWQLQSWIIHARNEGGAKSRLDKLEDMALILRGDLERIRRDVDKKSQSDNEKGDKLVSELKVLHTLLTQVMEKEIEFRKANPKADKSATKEATETKATTSTDIPETKQVQPATPDETVEPEEELLTEEEIQELELTPEEAALAMVDTPPEENDAIEDDQASSAPAKASGAGSRKSGKATPRGMDRKKAPIRLIKREDQLLTVIRSSLSENRVDLYMQPIVSLPSRKTVHYECLSRVRDEEGRIILPRQYMKVAEAKGLIGTIDNLLLFRLIQLVRRLGRRKPGIRFFCNMSRYSMMDDEFFPQFIDFMTSNEEFAERLVFEISQEDYLSLEGDVKERLMTLGRRGFAFSMDMVKDFNQDFTILGTQYFQFIKADLRDISISHPEEGDIESFKSFLRRNGMQLIVSRIEKEDMVLEALDARIEFAQGYLFGEPVSANELNQEL